MECALFSRRFGDLFIRPFVLINLLSQRIPHRHLALPNVPWHCFPNMLLLPFCRSELNYPVLGSDFASVMAVLPKIFLISLLGYFAIVVGGFAWRMHVGLGTRKLATQLLDILPRCSMMLMSSRGLLVFQALLCLVLQIVMLTLYFSQNGFGFDLRAYTFAHPEFRPVALIISNYSIVIASHSFGTLYRQEGEDSSCMHAVT